MGQDLGGRRVRYPWANTALLIVLVFQLATGGLGLISGSHELRWTLWLHGIGGYAAVFLLFWKGRIIFDAFKRNWGVNLTRLAFAGMAVLLLIVLATGLSWTFIGRRFFWGLSLMTIHTLLAVGLTVLLGWHTLARRLIFRERYARDRRAFLRLGGVGIVGSVWWGLARLATEALNLPGATRRFTGSYETGSMSGTFPAVSWLFDDPPPVRVQGWRMWIEGSVDRRLSLTYAQLLEFVAEMAVETIDCTGGWYSTQQWSGVPVAVLLEMAGVKQSARSVTFEAITGYKRRFPLAVARSSFLATHVAGQPLSHGHGFPLRLVASGHRGFEWVKWVTRLRVNETSHLLQPPLPLQ